MDPYQARARREAAMQQEGRQPTSDQPVRRDVLTPAMTSINTRIHAYEEKLKDWQEVERRSGAMGLSSEKLNRINECRSQLQDILLEYTALRKQLQQETSMDAAQLIAGNSLLQLNQQDIDYLESGCGNFLAELQTQQAPPTVVAADPQIKAAYENSDYDQVINLYQQMAQTPGQTPALETTYQYAQALLKNHQEAEAARLAEDLLARLPQQPDQGHLLLPVTQLVADLGFVRQDYDKARKLYEDAIRISIEKGARKDEWGGLQLAALQPGVVSPEELKDFGGLVQNYLAYVPKRDGYAVAEGVNSYLQQHPATRLAPNINVLRDKARAQADAWLNRGLQQVEAAAEAPKPQEGQAPGVPVSPPEKVGAATVPVAGTTGGTQEAITAQPPAMDAQSLQAEYDKASALLQAKEYDQALEGFSKLHNTALDAQARPMIAETSKQAGQAVRQKAAELFVRASNSRDPDEKRKLLLSSRDLLQSILTKYPQSGLGDKVQRNLARIESDLRALDASSVSRPVSSGGAYVPPSSGGGSR
ncbi:hypothetical protein [Desulfobulbus propionicus]